MRLSFFHNLSFGITENSADNYIIPISGYQEADGTLWFGSAGFGLCKYDEATEKQINYPSTRGMRVSGICRFDQNNLLITDRSQGLFLFNKRTGRVTPASFLTDLGISISSSRLTNLKTMSTPDGDIMLFNCNGRHLIYRHATKEIREISLQKNGEENRGVVVDVKEQPSHATVVCNGCIYEIDYRTLLARLVFSPCESMPAPSHLIPFAHKKHPFHNSL